MNYQRGQGTNGLQSGYWAQEKRSHFIPRSKRQQEMKSFYLFPQIYKKNLYESDPSCKNISVSKPILSSKNVCKTVRSIISNKTKLRNRFKMKIGKRLVDDALEVAKEFNRIFARAAVSVLGPRPTQQRALTVSTMETVSR